MSGTITKCKQCGSDRANRFTAEVAIQLTERQDLSPPIAWVFPELHVCFNCGFAEFMIPNRELHGLTDRDSAERTPAATRDRAA